MARRLAAPPLSEREESWFSEWRERLECWWMALPAPTQSELGTCIGALGVHLGSRFDDFRAARDPSKQSRATSSRWADAAEGALTPGCEWLLEHESAQERLALPPFPHADPYLRFDGEHTRSGRMPPIPRLMPSWERLHSLAAEGVEPPVQVEPLVQVEATAAARRAEAF